MYAVYAVHAGHTGAVIVAIQPAYGNARTRRHFATSLDRPVPFSEDPYRQRLPPDQRHQLTKLHPDGRAHFWGGTRSQAPKISQLHPGDLVLLTGQLHLRGVGEVAAVFDNVDFATTIWEPHPRRCSFEMVYSLTWFRRVEVPYAVVQTALGTSARDNFQALRLIRDHDRIDAVRRLLNRWVL